MIKFPKPAVEHYVVAYIIAAIITFGHAYNQVDNTRVSFSGVEIVNTPPDKAISALVSAICWPLYASFKLQEKK